MDLQQHEEIILRWISSCTSSEQLVLLRDVVKEFIEQRFGSRYELINNKAEKESKQLELKRIVQYLNDQIVEKNLIIAGGNKPEEKERPVKNQPPYQGMD